MAEAIPTLSPLYETIRESEINAAAAPPVVYDTAPFGQYLDSAIESLQGISNIEFKADATINNYVEGKVSMDQALMEVTKMTLSVQFAVTIFNQAVTTFRELQQIQV